MRELVLALCPGAGSSEFGLFDAARVIAKHVERHADALQHERSLDLVPARARTVRTFLDHARVGRDALAAVVAPGGLLRAVESGTYLVEDALLGDIEYGGHAANVGALVAKLIADDHGCPAYVVDPVSADELDPLARLSGLADLQRRGPPDTLAVRAIARRHAAAVQRLLAELRLVVVQLGADTSITAHREGRIVDAVHPDDGGPFSGHHCGSISAPAVVDLCFAPGATRDSVRARLFEAGGLESYLGTRDVRRAQERAERGDSKALVVLDAMAYQVAKCVGQMAAALGGEVDAVLVTGSAAEATAVVNGICRLVEWIAPVFVYPGEDELSALAETAWRVLKGEEPAKRYG